MIAERTRDKIGAGDRPTRLAHQTVGHQKGCDPRRQRIQLKNPVYIGKVAFKKETYKGEHDAIVQAPVWERAARIGDCLPVFAATAAPELTQRLRETGWLSPILASDSCFPTRSAMADSSPALATVENSRR